VPVADLAPPALAFLAAALAAAVNSVAGGGTLISFPVLLALGLPSVVANATSTVGLWPGSLGSLWGFRRELARADRAMLVFAIPCLVGGGAGAWPLRSTSSATFDRVVPFLVLLATVLFALRGRVQAWLSSGAARAHRSRAWLAGALAATLAVGVYGGYFGAGMSILMLSVLGMVGMEDLLEMNALTSLFSLCVNGVAIAIFVAAGLVRWDLVAAMALGALAGGYGAAGLARRLGRERLGRIVVALGLVVTAIFFARACG
jgi:uncharacterized membrane protein YfcA